MKLHRLAPCLLAVTLWTPARAQLRLPSLPAVGGTGELLRDITGSDPLARTRRGLDSALAPADLGPARQQRITALLRAHPRELQRDPNGEPVVRGELLGAPSTPKARNLLVAAGFAVLRETQLDGLDDAWLVLVPPPGADLAESLAMLRAADPAGSYDYQHVFTPSGAIGLTPTGASNRAAGRMTPSSAQVGLVDSGIDVAHPALRGALIHREGCDGVSHPAAHGTAVASLLVGRDGEFAGALPGGALWAADVYCDAATGGSVEAIARALAWLAREQVAVISISLVGPPNALLRHVVASLVSRGFLLVAAVGNDGPAAPPLYPAAWPGVVGITATDARRRVLPEAERGPQVMFSAPGADMLAASAGGRSFEPVRGTSFAAPLVAGLLAARLARPDPAAAARAVAGLAREAVDLGPPGRDPMFGYGLVGDTLRTDPRRLASMR